MGKRSPDADRLEMHVRLLQEQIARLTEEPPDIPFLACDSSCVVARPRGMHTNGGCRCTEQTLRRAVHYWRDVAERRQAQIQRMLSGEWTGPPSDER